MRCLVGSIVLAACESSHPGGADSSPAGAANVLDTTPNEWVWVPDAGTTCANGTPPGFGHNRRATPGGDVFVYFVGGGACCDTATCTANPPVAVNLDVTYSSAMLALD